MTISAQKKIVTPVLALFFMMLFVCCVKTTASAQNSETKPTATDTNKTGGQAVTSNHNPYFSDLSNVVSGTCVQLAEPNLTEECLDIVKKGNFKMVRTDFSWTTVETKAKGVYDWLFYDSVKNRLLSRGLRPLYCIDFNNDILYSKEFMGEIISPENVQGYVNFATAAAQRYASLKPVWEIYNEPNLPSFWITTKSREESAADYCNLAKAAILSMRAAVPDITIVAPGLAHKINTGKPDLEYLEYCFQNGLLDYLDGVSIHPYPTKKPEASFDYYKGAQQLIKKYGKGREVPIVCGETGYPLQWVSQSKDTQAIYVERQFLINYSLKVPVSNYYSLYDWVFGPFDSTDIECNFGLCNRDKSPKPSYNRVKNMFKTLSGLAFIKTYGDKTGDYKMEFSNGKKYITVAWTENDTHTDVIYGKVVTLSGTPVYIKKPKRFMQ
jgi:polysaccharide biosynthesis protein PslG